MAWCFVGQCPSGGKWFRAERQRSRLVLPEKPFPRWLQERLARGGVPRAGGGAPVTTGGRAPAPSGSGGPVDGSAFEVSRGALVVALVFVERGTCYKGPLTPMSPEFEFQHSWFLQPLDAFSLQVRRVWRFKHPHVALCGQGSAREGNCSAIHRGGKMHAFRPVPSIPGTEELECVRDGEVVGKTCLQDVIGDGAKVCCLQMFAPVTTLVASGLWTDLLWLGRWQLPTPLFEDFPQQDWVSRHQWDHEERNTEVNWGAAGSRLREISYQLRQWAPSILEAERGSQEEESVAGTELMLESCVRFLDKCAWKLQPSCDSVKVARQRHAACTLIQSILLAWGIKDKGKMNNVLSQALELCFPGGGKLLQVRAAPSPSTVNRSQFLVDVAMMVRRQLEWTNRSLHYLFADASPQGGRDWLMSRQVEIDRSHLVEVWEAAMALERQEEPHTATTDACNCILTERVSLHLHAPVALGLGQMSVSHKCAALLHAMFLETPSWNALKTTLSNVVSVTTDMGTELSMPDFHCQLRDLLPPWMTEACAPLEPDLGEQEVRNVASLREQAFQCDVEVMAEPCMKRRVVEPADTVLSHAAQQMSALVAEPQLRLAEPPPEVPAPTLVAEPQRGLAAEPPQEVRAPALVAPALAPVAEPQPRLESAEAVPGAPGREGSASEAEGFLPGALPVPGLLHIAHNLTRDVHTALPWWERFWVGAKNVEALLTHRLRRERFVAHCMQRHRGMEEVTRKILGWTWTIHEARWGSVVRFLVPLREVFGALRMCWREEEYLRGLRSREDDVAPRSRGDVAAGESADLVHDGEKLLHSGGFFQQSASQKRCSPRCGARSWMWC